MAGSRSNGHGTVSIYRLLAMTRTRCEVRSLELDEKSSGTCRVTDAWGPGREAEVVGELRST